MKTGANMRRVASDRTLRQNVVVALNELLGQACIYSEEGHVRLVIMDGIKTDDWGVSLDVTVAPGVGLEHRSPAGFTFDARWDALWISPHAMFAPEVGWMLLTEPRLVQEVTTAAQSGQTRLDLLVHVYRLASSGTDEPK